MTAVEVDRHSLRARLQNALPALGLDLKSAHIDALMMYLDLIQKWNKVYNLTAVRDPADMLTHHLLDSLAVIAPLRARLEATQNALPHFTAAASGEVHAPVAWRLLDVGSGAGLPGIVIAICCPDIQVDCVDTVAKKAAFIQQAAVTLKLTNLRGVHARVENLAGPYDVISSRAFASLVDFTTWSQAALAEQGIWMAMKGKHPDDELAALPKSVEVFHVEQLNVPGLDAERCIVWMRAAG